MWVDFEMFQTAVTKTVKDRTGWKTVCVDGLRQFYDGNEFEKAVQHAINQTIYWEGKDKATEFPLDDLSIYDDGEDEIEPETLSEALEEYQNIHGFCYNLTGLNKLCEAIGYRSHQYKNGSPLEVFLEDNPGAIEAIAEWIEKQDFNDWRDEVISHLPSRD